MDTTSDRAERRAATVPQEESVTASMESITELGTTAAQAIRKWEAAALEVRVKLRELTAIQQERPQEKLEAVCRLVHQDHPANPGKRFSISQAEDVLQIDPEYSAYKVRCTEAEAALREAEDYRDVCRLTAEYCVATFKKAGNLE